MALQDVEELERLIRTEPFVLEPRCVRQLDVLREIAGPFAPLADLLIDARESVADAWTNFEERREHQEQQLAGLEATHHEIFGLLQARDFERALELAEAALPSAVEAGLWPTIAIFEDLRAQALFQTYSDDRAERIEAAIEGFNRALRLAVDPVLRGTVLMHLGLAYGERIKGDRADNLDMAVAALRESVDGLDESSPSELRSLRLTNLAWALLRRERGDRATDLREAAELCRAALRHRSLTEEPIDWAHTQLNLGDALTQLWELGLVSREEPVSAHEVVIESADRLPEPWLVGAAHFALGRLERMAAHRSPQQVVESYEPGNEPEEFLDLSLLESAAEHLQRAVDLSPLELDAIRRGRVLSELAGALMTLGRNAEAISAAAEGLRILTPASDPLGCASVGGTLGGLLAGEGRWDESASAFRAALEASELSFHSRLDTVAREDQAERAGRLHRWAAYSLARAGQIEEATIALENGRTRELRRRLGRSHLDERLRQLPDEYRVAYEAAASRLTASPLGPPSADAGRELQTILTAIRALPGYQDFAAGTTVSDLVHAVEEEWPLVYIDPTPMGTLLLLVEQANDKEVRLSSRFLDVTSRELFLRLAIGGAAEAPASGTEEQQLTSYLGGIGALGTAQLEPALDELLPWLGTVLVSPIYEWLHDLNKSGMTLIGCGPIGTAPIHAAHWQVDEERRRLIDRFELRYAPSAVVAASAIRRASEHTTADPYLVGLADPTGDLPAAIPEIAEIEKHFVDRSACAVGKHATWQFLQRTAEKATHLHLSCHARGGLYADSDTLLLLADGPVALGQLTELQLTTRLTTASACQTALSNMARLQDESLSIGTALLAVGSACAIASLWPVHDAATAVLMIRVYEEMIRNALNPPQALRRAALWLETASGDEVSNFLAQHPRLKAEFARRSDLGETTTRGPSSASPAAPFAHPVYWAAFIASGA